MRAFTASWNLHEFIPIVNWFLLATSPKLFQVVENGFTRVECARFIAIFFFTESPLCAPLVRTHEFPVFSEHSLFLSSFFHFSFFLGKLFLLSIKVFSSFNLSESIFLNSFEVITNRLTSSCICYGRRLSDKSFLFFVGMLTNATSYELLELVPVKYYLVAA